MSPPRTISGTALKIGISVSRFSLSSHVGMESKQQDADGDFIINLLISCVVAGVNEENS